MAARIYKPRTGELVRDRLTGRIGECMEAMDTSAYLRPEGGGVEWRAYFSEIEPIAPAHQAVTVIPRQPSGSLAWLRPDDAA